MLAEVKSKMKEKLDKAAKEEKQKQLEEKQLEEIKNNEHSISEIYNQDFLTQTATEQETDIDSMGFLRKKQYK